MTPKEKAKHLFEEYSFFEIGGYNGKSEIKDMAKLCVDEILDFFNSLGWKLENGNGNVEFWQEVKSEIEKL